MNTDETRINNGLLYGYADIIQVCNKTFAPRFYLC